MRGSVPALCRVYLCLNGTPEQCRAFELKRTNILTLPCAASSVPVKKAGILTELRRREYYEKPTQERKRKKAAAVKRHLKRISREEAKRKRLY